MVIKPIDNYMVKVNNRNTRTRCEICSKLTTKTPERRHWRRSGVYSINLEHLVPHFTPCSSVYIVDFEQVNYTRNFANKDKPILKILTIRDNFSLFMLIIALCLTLDTGNKLRKTENLVNSLTGAV